MRSIILFRLGFEFSSPVIRTFCCFTERLDVISVALSTAIYSSLFFFNRQENVYEDIIVPAVPQHLNLVIRDIIACRISYQHPRMNVKLDGIVVEGHQSHNQQTI